LENYRAAGKTDHGPERYRQEPTRRGKDGADSLCGGELSGRSMMEGQ